MSTLPDYRVKKLKSQLKNVFEYTAEGISLIGEVNRSGVYPAVGAHRLIGLIQTAGGFTDKAEKIVTAIRRGGYKWVKEPSPTHLATPKFRRR